MCGPRSRQADALPATREKPKIGGEFYLGCIRWKKGQREREEEARGSFLYSLQSWAPVR